MQHSPQELKEKLLKGLDDDNNVVDMATVLAVITILENYPITRDALEQTRIGRYVNELRKKTKNEQLAKRAKKLVRSWQKLITPAETPPVNGTHGERVAPSHPNLAALQGIGSKPNSPASSCKSASPASYSPQLYNRSSLSKPQMGYKPNTPTLQQTSPALARTKPNTPSLPQTQVRSRPTTPNMSQYSKKGMTASPYAPKDHSTPKSDALSTECSKMISPESSSAVSLSSRDLISNKSRPNTPSVYADSPSIAQEGRLSRNMSQESLCSSISPEARIPSLSHHSKGENGKVVSPSAQNDSSLNVKTNAANRKRTRDSNQNSSAGPNKHSNGESGSVKKVMNGALSSFPGDKDGTHKSKISPSDSKLNLPSRRNACLNVSTDSRMSDKSIKTPKVKTTTQLIAELRAKSGSTAIGSSVIHQIETNQIEKESDELPSVLPPGARPKRRRRDLPQEPSTPSRPHTNLSQTKTELVEKFLETSITPSTAVDMSPFKYDISKSESLEKEDTSAEVDITDSSGGDTSFRPPEVGSKEQVEPGDKDATDITKKDDKTKTVTLEELYSQLPPVDYDNIRLDDDDYELPPVIPVDDDRVRSLHDEQVIGVNGCYDINGAWHDWTQTLTLPSYEGDPLHILPYVLLDD